MRRFLTASVLCLLLAGCDSKQASGPVVAPVITLPPAPTITPEGLTLIIEFETSGEASYNRHPFPEWPGGSSGVTWGIGYDATAQAESLILSDWRGLHGNGRLAAMHPYSGASAKSHLRDVANVRVPWALSLDVFTSVDLARVSAQCRRAFPGFDTLRSHAQDALRSLVYNRGPGMVGDSRREMRAIRDLVPQRDYEGMAAQIRAMVRVWRGTSIYSGMKRRRAAEAALMLTP